MPDFRDEHRDELLEKQRHISQKLAQVREFIALVRKWKRQLAQLEQWFAGLETSAQNAKWFSMTSLIRMGSIGVQLEQMLGEFAQVGNPKTTGTGTVTSSGATTGTGAAAATGTTAGTTPAGSQRQHSLVVQNLMDRAGPLAARAPWELIWDLDPEVSESMRTGDTGVAVIQALSSPITSLTAIGFGEEMLELSVEMIEEHEADFDTLESSWKSAKENLGKMSDALDGIDLGKLDGLADELGGTLNDYEQAWDNSVGDDTTSSRELRERASGRRQGS